MLDDKSALLEKALLGIAIIVIAIIIILVLFDTVSKIALSIKQTMPVMRP